MTAQTYAALSNLETFYLVNRCGWTVRPDGAVAYPAGTPRHGYDDEEAAVDWAESFGPELGPEPAPKFAPACQSCGSSACRSRFDCSRA